MPATWRQCDHCLDWRTDVAARGHVLESGGLCSDCTRVVGTPTKSRADARDMSAAPQEGGRDRLARFEENLGRDLEVRGRARRRNDAHRPDAVPATVLNSD